MNNYSNSFIYTGFAKGSCAQKRISDICHLRSRFMLLAYLNPIYYIYVELM